jgi:hypothetical protein
MFAGVLTKSPNESPCVVPRLRINEAHYNIEIALSDPSSLPPGLAIFDVDPNVLVGVQA